MWLSGRRAFRPDSQVYRTLRKQRRSRHRGVSGKSAVGAIVFAIIAGAAWWMIKG